MGRMEALSSISLERIGECAPEEDGSRLPQDHYSVVVNFWLEQQKRRVEFGSHDTEKAD